MQILLSTEFKVGDIIQPIVNELYEEDSHLFYVVCGYDIIAIDDSGQVISYFIKAIGQMGDISYFTPQSIKHK